MGCLLLSPMLGNMGPRTTSSVRNAVGGSNIGRIISSGGLSVPGIASHMNLSRNVGSGNLARIQWDDEWYASTR